MAKDRDEVSSDRSDGDPDSEPVTEAEALAEGGTRYRTLEVSKSGESGDEDAE